MNEELIDRLMVQAGARFEFLHGVHYDNFHYRTFAELIIQECYDVVMTGDRYRREYFADKIKKHFGMEE